MRVSSIIRLILWLAVALICFFILVGGILNVSSYEITRPLRDWGRSVAGQNDRVESSRGTEEYAAMVDETYTHNVSDVKRIDANIAWADLEIFSTQDSEIKVEIMDARQDEFEVHSSGSSYVISQNEFKRNFWSALSSFWYDRARPKVRLTIPAEYSRSLRIRTASGGVAIQDAFTLESLTVDSASGELDINGALDCHDISLKSASGALSASALTCDDFELGFVSGRADIDSLKCRQFHITMTSGNLDVREIDGYGSLSMVSGRVKLNFMGVTGNLTVNSVSGNVDIQLPGDADVYTNTESMSGRISDDFVRSSGSREVQIKTISGSIDLIAK